MMIVCIRESAIIRPQLESYGTQRISSATNSWIIAPLTAGIVKTIDFSSDTRNWVTKVTVLVHYDVNLFALYGSFKPSAFIVSNPIRTFTILHHLLRIVQIVSKPFGYWMRVLSVACCCIYAICDVRRFTLLKCFFCMRWVNFVGRTRCFFPIFFI